MSSELQSPSPIPRTIGVKAGAAALQGLGAPMLERGTNDNNNSMAAVGRLSNAWGEGFHAVGGGAYKTRGAPKCQVEGGDNA